MVTVLIHCLLLLPLFVCVCGGGGGGLAFSDLVSFLVL